MDWGELLATFRELGGIADNVRLGEGPFGRGVFVCDPSKPATLHASENLLVPIDDLEIRDGQLRHKTADGGRRARAEILRRLRAAFRLGRRLVRRELGIAKAVARAASRRREGPHHDRRTGRSARTISPAVGDLLLVPIRADALVYVRRRARSSHRSSTF